MSIYICPECGNEMVWENRLLGALVCEECGYGVNRDRYGKTDEEYEDLYPVDEDDEDDDSGDTYEEAYDELSNKLED